MGKRRVEITIISAEGLKLASSVGKPRTYAVVWIHPSKKFYTRVEDQGGKNPVWDHKLVLSTDTFSLEQGSGKFHIEIFQRGDVHDMSIGTVDVPFTEIPDEARFSRDEVSKIQYMAFEIRRPSGKNKGVLNLSIRLREIYNDSSSSSSCSSQPSSPKFKPEKSFHEDHPPPAADPPAPPAYAPSPYSTSPYPPSNYPPSNYPPSNYPPSNYPPAGYPASSFDRGYGNPPQQSYGGYGYGSSAPGYGTSNYYNPAPPPPPPAKSGHSNLALGAGIAAGALGGLVLGEVVENIAENAAEDAVEESFDDDF